MSLHFLVDGYNTIKQIDSLKQIRSLRVARSALIKSIRAKLIKSRHNQATVVFDSKQECAGFSSASLDESRDIDKNKALINVIFSAGKTADEVIKNLVQYSPRPGQIAVVSDDKAIVFFIRSLGAKAVSVAEFLGRGKQTKKQRIIRQDEPLKMELTYRQQEAINRELRRIWK